MTLVNHGDAGGRAREPRARYGWLACRRKLAPGPARSSPPSPRGGWGADQSNRWRLARRALRAQRRRRLAIDVARPGLPGPAPGVTALHEDR
jgi:hypothetical protein